MCAPFFGLSNEGCEAYYKWMVLEVGCKVASYGANHWTGRVTESAHAAASVWADFPE